MAKNKIILEDNLGNEVLPVTDTDSVFMMDYSTKLTDKLKNFDSSLDSKTTYLENTKATKTEVDVERKRIDSFTSLASGSTTGDAELIDGRVGSNGKTYTNIGGAIRGQINDSIANTSSVKEITKNLKCNLFNINNVSDGKVVDPSGNVIDNSGVSVTNDYIYLCKGEKITLNFSATATILVYNTDKSWVKRVVVPTVPYTYTTDQDCYVRFNVYTGHKEFAVVTKGETLDDFYLAAGKYNLTNCNNIEKIEQQIKTNFYYNLVNKSNMVDGKILNGDNSTTTLDGCSYTKDYIYMKLGEKITVNFNTHATIVRYDLSKNCLGRVITDVAPYTYTATENGYIRFNIYTGVKDTAVACWGEKALTGLGYYDLRPKDNSLKGNYLFLGDSICYGAGANEKGGYSKLIANSNPKMTYKNIGVSGATLGRRPSGDAGASILNKLEGEIALNNTYTHIVIEGGINDIWNQATWSVGDYDLYDKTTTLDEMTICGALESIIRKSQSSWSNAKYYYIIPHSISPKVAKPVFDKLIGLCEKYNVIVIDLRKLSGMDTDITYIKQTYTANADGVHPTDPGYEKFYINPIIHILNQH